ncbi:MAG: polysaccharide deacetylase family protein [Pseudomonadota bacterium]
MRFLTRRRTLAAAAILAVLLAVLIALFAISKARCFQLIGTPICRVETSEKLVALTFDDGPDKTGVDAILPVLARYRAHATFFLIGRGIENAPGEAHRLLAAGHELGNHSYSHPRMWGLFPGAYEEEIRRTDALLRREGASPTLFRPPYGKRLTGLPIAVANTGYRMVTWDIEDPDASLDARGYADRVLEQVHPGAIILIHAMYPNRRTAREALPLILEGLKQRGYRAVTVSELLRHAAR